MRFPPSTHPIPTPAASPSISVRDHSFMSSEQRLPPRGWFPDPSGQMAWRWWDGTSWTALTLASGGFRPQSHARRDWIWVVLTAICAALLLTSLAALRSDSHNLRVHQNLARHPVRVTGTVKAVKYDPDGGDPGGWSTVTVRYFMAGHGSYTLTYGHHYAPTEVIGGTVPLVADTQHPQVADRPGFDLNELQGDVVDSQVFVAVTAILTLVMLAGWGFTRRSSRRRTATHPHGAALA